MPRTTTRIAIGLGMVLCGALGGLAAANVNVATLDDVPPRAPDVNCSTGRVNRTFGASEWLVYSCDNDRTLVFLSTPGSPADPYYFTVFPQGGEYHLFGEGTGDRQATDAAFKETEHFSLADIRSLIDETKTARPQ